jgi:rhamnulokinase
MTTPAHYLAIDLGASSGRGVIGTLHNGKLSLREVHRFENGPVQLETGMHWDFARLSREITTAIRAAATSLNDEKLSGIAIDTWGVDYGLLDADGTLLAPPFHYRDPRTCGLVEEVTASVSREEIYRRTGIQFMQLNTLYQLVAERRSGSKLLERASRLLFIPDLLGHHLTGAVTSETSIASTSQLFDANLNRWSWELIDALGLPRSVFPEVVKPATTIGTLLPAVAASTGAGQVPVIAPAGHDTGSAVAAVPATGPRTWAYISSGTWSLLGRELTVPLCSKEALAANFTNEAGVEGTIRFHKNIAGLWLLQECRRVWLEQGHRASFEELVISSGNADPLRSLVDPDAPQFAEFGDMPARIRAFCSATHEEVPETIPQVVRCILESLALKYRSTLETLIRLTGSIDRIHIVGGGVQNTTLCQYTADAMGLPVIAGPVEATAAGNIMTQALAQGRVRDLAHIRDVIASSTELKRYEPTDASAWSEAYGRFRTIAK